MNNHVSNADFEITKKKIKKNKNSKIEISFFGMSRGRSEILKKSIINIYGLANKPYIIEYLLRIDDDDQETIDLLLHDEDLKIFENLRCFIGPRVGYKYLYRILVQFMKMVKGDIFSPFADDHEVRLKDWDNIVLSYKNQEVVFGTKARIMFTRKAYEKHSIISSWNNTTIASDTSIYKYAIKNKIYISTIKKIWARQQVQDKTHMESWGGWELTDKEILKKIKLNELPLIEIDRYKNG